MRRFGGPALLLPVLFTVLFFPYGRAALQQEEPPAFFVETAKGIWIGCGKGFPSVGIHQFSDGATLRDVIEMTGLPVNACPLPDELLNVPLLSGVRLDFLPGDSECLEIQSSWLPAGQRVALGLPLHPDHMSLEDWEFLPGIGPALAKAIEIDRQKNGDFGDLKNLKRVRGIGQGRIASWREFFSDR